MPFEALSPLQRTLLLGAGTATAFAGLAFSPLSRGAVYEREWEVAREWHERGLRERNEQPPTEYSVADKIAVRRAYASASPPR